MAQWQTLLVSWLILSLKLWHGVHAKLISKQIVTDEQRNYLQVRALPYNADRSVYQRALLQEKSLMEHISIGSRWHLESAAIAKTRKVATLSTRSHGSNIRQERILWKRADKGRGIGDGSKKPTPPNAAGTPKTSPSKPSSSKPGMPIPSPPKYDSLTGQSLSPLNDKLLGLPNLTPLKSHVEEAAAKPNSIFTPMHDPLGVSRPVSDPLTHSSGTVGSYTPSSRDQPSSSRSPTERKVSKPKTVPDADQGSTIKQRRRREGDSTKEQSPRRERPEAPTSSTTHGPQPPANKKEVKEWQRNAGLVWDWACENKKKAIAAGVIITGGCASVSGIPLAAYGAGAGFKAAGVALTMAGPSLATTAGTLLAAAGIGEFKNDQAISEQRQEEKWEDFLNKSRLKKVPSVDQMASSIKPKLEKVSSSTGNIVNAVVDNLKKLNIGIKNPSSDTSTAPEISQLVVPENPEEMSATWSSPNPFPSRTKPSNPRRGTGASIRSRPSNAEKGKSIQMQSMRIPKDDSPLR